MSTFLSQVVVIAVVIIIGIVVFGIVNDGKKNIPILNNVKKERSLRYRTGTQVLVAKSGWRVSIRDPFDKFSLKKETIGILNDEDDGFTIGRGSQCDLVINNPRISEVHAIIKRDSNGKYTFVDNMSTNGTFIDGQKVYNVELSNGLKLYLADTPIVFENDDHPPVNEKGNTKVNSSGTKVMKFERR